MSFRRASLWVLVASGAATTAVLVEPHLAFSYRNPSLRASIETALGIVAGLGAYLAVGRFRRARASSELWTAMSLGALCFANLALTAMPSVLDHPWPVDTTTWAGVAARCIATSCLGIAALAPDRRLDRRGELRVEATVVAFGVLALAAGLLAHDHLPDVRSVVAENVRSANPSDEVLVTGPLLLNMAWLAAAAIGFVRRSGGGGDDVAGWLAVGAVLEAVAYGNYVLSPSLFSDRIHVGDLYRLAGYVVWFVGGTREIAAYWRSAAVAEERRRIARDLHDGLAQELAFIASRTAAMGDVPDAPAVGHVQAAAERALDEARRAIESLTTDPGAPLPTVLERAAEDVAARHGTRVLVESSGAVEVDGPRREALVRIVREAVTNAAHHGGASLVSVRIDAGPPARIEVVDDGSGFDPELRTGGFGLASMRDRAEGLGGRLDVRSAHGRGTTVAVVLP